MDPAAFLSEFANSGPVTGATVFPVYFVGANLAMLDPAFPPQAVRAERTAWYRWNWVRTGLGIASAALSCIALAAGRRENVTRPR